MTTLQPATQAAPPAPPSVMRHPGFRRLFTAAAAGKLGTQIGYVAIPLLAVTTLHAGAGQVGLLATLSTLSFLLIGLPAGAWVDRMRRRRVMIAADLSRGLLLGSVPVAWLMDSLTMNQLYAVVLLSGVATVFAEVGQQSYLPQLVDRDQLPAANSALVSVDALNQLAGRSVGGFLVQLVAAPAAIAVNALTDLWSAAWIATIRQPDVRPERTAQRNLVKEVNEGLRFVLKQPVLRAVAAAGAMNNLSIQVSVTMLPVVFVNELGLSEGAVGLYLAVGGIGVFLGARSSRRIGEWLGQGRTLWILGLAVAPFALLVPLVDRGTGLWLAGLSWLLTTFRVGVNNVIQVSFRQRCTPGELLGRMNATMRFLLTGALAVGAALAGSLGAAAGPRAALWAGAIGMALVWIPIFLSPLRTMRTWPDDLEN
ncbi:MFS transporter [Streptomyces sp. NPDC015661]|uniref:MFS transporter n=1 Tax=Streptomyces sp. NPDC015661 TaxID=3364961 RepID=UPI0036F5E4F1